MLLAVGALRSRELCPASDLDLVLIHDGRRGATSASSPIDSGTRSGTRGCKLDHSVRTPNQARRVADDDLKAALGLLDRGSSPATVRWATSS